MEYIYICPKCGAVYGRAERTSRACSSCGTALVDSNYTSDVWDKLPPGRKAEVVKEFSDGEVPTKEASSKETEEMNPKLKFYYATNSVGAGVCQIICAIILFIIGLVIYNNNTYSVLGYTHRSNLAYFGIFLAGIGVLGIISGIAIILRAMARKAEQDKPAQEKDAAPSQENAMDQLKKLKELFDMGVITEAEYNEKREKLMKDI